MLLAEPPGQLATRQILQAANAMHSHSELILMSAACVMTPLASGMWNLYVHIVQVVAGMLRWG